MNILRQLYSKIILSKRDKNSIKRLVQMWGITTEQQQELYDFALDSKRFPMAIRRMELYRNHGALEKYDIKGFWIEHEVLPKRNITAKLGLICNELDNDR